jgi:hypothetical protein
MLSDALGTLGSFFSRSFIVGYVFPALVAILLNGVLIALASKGVEGSVAYLRDDLKIGEVATALGIAVLLATALAFSLAPMVQAFRRALEGDVVVGWPRRHLIEHMRENSGKVIRAREAALGTGAMVAVLQDRSYQRFSDALRKGEELGTAADEPSVVAAETAVETAAEAVRLVDAHWDRGDYDDALGKAEAAALRGALDAVEQALQVNDRTPSPDAPQDQHERAARLRMAHERLVELLFEARSGLRTIISDLEGRIETYMLSKDPQPTRLGNLNSGLRAHCRNVYGAGFDYLWPRIRLLIGNDQDKFEAVEQAQTQLHYALGMLLLTVLSAVGWFGWLTWRHDAPAIILLAGLAAPLLCVFFYRAVLESQLAAIEAIKAAIARHRFDLLIQLHVPLPASYRDEVNTWRTLEQMSSGYLRSTGDVVYEHPEK